MMGSRIKLALALFAAFAAVPLAVKSLSASGVRLGIGVDDGDPVFISCRYDDGGPITVTRELQGWLDRNRSVTAEMLNDGVNSGQLRCNRKASWSAAGNGQHYLKSM